MALIDAITDSEVGSGTHRVAPQVNAPGGDDAAAPIAAPSLRPSDVTALRLAFAEAECAAGLRSTFSAMVRHEAGLGFQEVHAEQNAGAERIIDFIASGDAKRLRRTRQILMAMIAAGDGWAVNALHLLHGPRPPGRREEFGELAALAPFTPTVQAIRAEMAADESATKGPATRARATEAMATLRERAKAVLTDAQQVLAAADETLAATRVAVDEAQAVAQAATGEKADRAWRRVTTAARKAERAIRDRDRVAAEVGAAATAHAATEDRQAERFAIQRAFETAAAAPGRTVTHLDVFRERLAPYGGPVDDKGKADKAALAAHEAHRRAFIASVKLECMAIRARAIAAYLAAKGQP